MKFISFALALLAAIGIVVQPIAPAYAVTADEPLGSVHTQRLESGLLRGLSISESLDEFILNAQIAREMREKLVNHARRGEAAIFSQAQMDDLARTHPALHAKLMNAYRNMSVPHLTAAEKNLVDQITAGNLDAFKAGGLPEGCGTGVSNGSIRVADASMRMALFTTTNCSNTNNTAAIVVALTMAVLFLVPLLLQIFGVIH